MQVLERKHSNEEALSREKSSSYEEHIRMLQDENSKLADSVRIKRDHISQSILK